MGWSQQGLKIVAIFSCVYEQKMGSRALDFNITPIFIAAVSSLEYGREGQQRRWQTQGCHSKHSNWHGYPQVTFSTRPLIAVGAWSSGAAARRKMGSVT
jgi:hypothetical protein